jgi:hypothetical protein
MIFTGKRDVGRLMRMIMSCPRNKAQIKMGVGANSSGLERRPAAIIVAGHLPNKLGFTPTALIFYLIISGKRY